GDHDIPDRPGRRVAQRTGEDAALGFHRRLPLDRSADPDVPRCGQLRAFHVPGDVDIARLDADGAVHVAADDDVAVEGDVLADAEVAVHHVEGNEIERLLPDHQAAPDERAQLAAVAQKLE